MKNGSVKISKGYRLKDSTHRLIEKLQVITNGSKDTVISKAMTLYYSHVNNRTNHSNQGNSKLRRTSNPVNNQNTKTKSKQ